MCRARGQYSKPSMFWTPHHCCARGRRSVNRQLDKGERVTRSVSVAPLLSLCHLQAAQLAHTAVTAQASFTREHANSEHASVLY
jgi:hypothetical protein